MAHETAHSTRCNICGQNFVGPTVIVGAPPTTRVVEYVNKLRAHLAEKHPDVYTGCDLNATQFLTALCLMNFHTNDQQLAYQIDFLRWQVHQKTLLARIPDDKLNERVNELATELVAIIRPTLIDLVSESETRTDGEDETLLELIQTETVVNFRAKLTEIFKGLRALLEEPDKYPVSKVERPGNGRILTPR
jgi:hypothetical protein